MILRDPKRATDPMDTPDPMETARCTATSLPIAEGNNPANVSRPAGTDNEP